MCTVNDNNKSTILEKDTLKVQNAVLAEKASDLLAAFLPSVHKINNKAGKN